MTSPQEERERTARARAAFGRFLHWHHFEGPDPAEALERLVSIHRKLMVKAVSDAE